MSSLSELLNADSRKTAVVDDCLSLIDAEVGYSFLVYEVTIVDRDGTALISSDSLSWPPGQGLSTSLGPTRKVRSTSFRSERF